MTVKVAHALRPCPGFDVSGDAAVVRVCEGSALFGVVDALGHGPHAARVAQLAMSFLDQVDLSRALGEILEELHDVLARTRGAAIGLCLLHDDVVDVSIVGNVEIRSVGTPVGVVAAPGILGRRVRKFRYSRSHLRRGDRLVVYSDGLSRPEIDTVRRMPPLEACQELLRRHGRPADDASVVVADFMP